MSTPERKTQPKTETKPTAPGKTSRRGLAIGAAVAAAAILLGVASYAATKPDTTSSAAADDSPAAEVSADPQAGVYRELAKLARRDAKDSLAQGRADAPVVLIEYADFKCGYCGKFARDTEPDLVKKYVDDGTLRIEWRNFPIFGKESDAAARGAWAAGQQDRFWQFHAAAYADGAKEKGFGESRLKAIAEEAGVKDLGRFTEDTKSEAAKSAVKADQDEAYRLGATSTPSFLVNGRPIAGAQPAEVFTQAIDAAAKTAKSAKKGKGAGSEPNTKPDKAGSDKAGSDKAGSDKNVQGDK